MERNVRSEQRGKKNRLAAPQRIAIKLAFLGISKLQAALEGVAQRFADCMRQVNIRCLDDDRIRLLFNPHNAVLGMLWILFPLTVSNQIKQFRCMTQREVAADRDYSCRVTIASPMRMPELPSNTPVNRFSMGQVNLLGRQWFSPTITSRSNLASVRVFLVD
jgi:hypothetical protein